MIVFVESMVIGVIAHLINVCDFFLEINNLRFLCVEVHYLKAFNLVACLRCSTN